MQQNYIILPTIVLYHQNRIKSSTRATLGVSVLEDLIRLSSEGSSVADFDRGLAVNRWFARNKSKGEHVMRPNFLNY